MIRKGADSFSERPSSSWPCFLFRALPCVCLFWRSRCWAARFPQLPEPDLKL